jgi:tetratricopeptide (TPR) repeat protein
MMTYRTLGLFLTLSLSIFYRATYSQSEKEIVAKHKSALGKTANDDSFVSCSAKGVAEVLKIRMPISLYVKKSAFRIEAEFQGLSFVKLSNDSLEWDYNPINGSHKIVRKGESGKQSQEDNGMMGFLLTDLINYQELKNKLKVVRHSTLDSVSVTELELTIAKSGKKVMIYMDRRNSLIYKVENDEGSMYFLNYKIVDGFTFPTRFLQYKEDKTDFQFDQILVNIPLADSIFVVPPQAFEKVKSNTDAFDRTFSEIKRLYESGKPDDCISLCNRALGEHGHNALIYNYRGLAKTAHEEYYDAIADFTTALKYRANDAVIINNRGLAKYYLEDFKGAQKDYDLAISLDSSNTTFHQNRGRLHLQLEEYELAVQEYSIALRLDSTNAAARYQRAICYAQLEKYGDALAEYQRLARHPEDMEGFVGEFYNNKGVSEYEMERMDSAKLSFQRALAQEPEELQYIFNYGMTLFNLEDNKAARKQFERYLSLNAESGEAYNMLGLLNCAEEEYKGAIKDFSKAIELNPGNARYFDNRAAAKEEIEDYEGAIADYSESIRLYPNDPSVFYKRGLVKILTSRKHEGCLDLATADEMDYEPAEKAIFKNCP